MGSAVEELNEAIEKDYNTIVGNCAKRLNSTEEGMEVANEAIARALNHLKRHPDFRADNWRSWLWRIVHNLVIDRYRKRDNERSKTYSLTYPIAHKPHSANSKGQRIIADFAENPYNSLDTYSSYYTETNGSDVAVDSDYADDIHRKDLATTLNHLIETALTELQRRALVLHYYYGLSRYQMAELLHPEQPKEQAAMRVAQLIWRARQRLRALLEQPQNRQLLAG